MSLNISNVILHKLTKNDQDELVVKLRHTALSNDAVSEQLVAELHRTFNAKASKGFGIYKEESEFQYWMKQFRQGDLSFYDFSSQSAERLKTELAKYPFADEGVLVMAQYQSLATEYLFIALLPSNQSLKVDDALDISGTDYLDINKMDIAVRIDLSCYETDSESNRYLTYIKGRVGRKVADFFLDFLQAEIGLDTKKQNLVLMQAVDDYCADSQLNKEETVAYRKQVHDYCNDQLKAGDEVTIRELSGELSGSGNDDNFQDFTQKQGYELEDSFPVDRSTIRKLAKYVGAGGGLSINFDSMLLGERIFYDPETDTLTIKGIPPNLKDQLVRHS